jgi:hypothetical protein
VKPFTEVTVTDGISEYFFHLELPGFEPVRMYRWADELAGDAKNFEYLDDEDEQDLANPRNYRAGKNALFVHAWHKAMIRRTWAYLEFSGFTDGLLEEADL